jgi:hypothetical protein
MSSIYRLGPSRRLPFDRPSVAAVPRSSGVYIIFDLAGPMYVGRSRVDIRRRLQGYLDGTRNRNIALARRVGAGASLSFSYCLLPRTVQGEIESLLIAALGVARFANLRREGLVEDDLQE